MFSFNNILTISVLPFLAAKIKAVSFFYSKTNNVSNYFELQNIIQILCLSYSTQ